MRNYFTFGNFDSRDYGVFTIQEGVYNAPARTVRVVSVPGRNGDLIIDEGRLENINVTYPCVIYSQFDSHITGIRNALLSTGNYVRIVDSFHPDEFRLGTYMDEFSVVPTMLADGGRFDVVFNCKPQRYLVSGETSQSFTGSGTIANPTLFDAKPLIRVTGYGTLTIGSDVITITQGFAYVDINSETQDCYHGTDNANRQVTFQSRSFPVLAPGSTGISFSGNITKVEITPRWYRV